VLYTLGRHLYRDDGAPALRSKRTLSSYGRRTGGWPRTHRPDGRTDRWLAEREWTVQEYTYAKES